MSSDQYTLFELVGDVKDAQAQTNFSPFVTTTLADLAILGIKVQEKKLTFAGIQTELAQATGNKNVTVPTLKVKEGEYITDSFAIAEWLDAHHGTPERSLLVNHEGLLFARFITTWANTVLAPSLRDTWWSLVYLVADKPSQEYFSTHKFPSLDAIRDGLALVSDEGRLATAAEGARRTLGLMERYLAASGGPFLLGTKASHADSAVYGWYGSSQLNAKVNALVWEHEELPHVKAWVRAMNQLVGVEFDYKVPPVPKQV